MSEVRALLSDISRSETLPPICIRCGRPAKGMRGVRLLAHEARRESFWGGLLYLFGIWSRQTQTAVDNYAHAQKIARGKLQLPVCWWHRWIMPPFVGASLEREMIVTLSGVCDAFVAVLKKQGKVR